MRSVLSSKIQTRLVPSSFDRTDSDMRSIFAKWFTMFPTTSCSKCDRRSFSLITCLPSITFVKCALSSIGKFSKYKGSKEHQHAWVVADSTELSRARYNRMYGTVDGGQLIGTQVVAEKPYDSDIVVSIKLADLTDPIRVITNPKTNNFYIFANVVAGKISGPIRMSTPR